MYGLCGLFGVILVVTEVIIEYDNKKFSEKLLTEPKIHGIMMPEVKGR